MNGGVERSWYGLGRRGGMRVMNGLTLRTFYKLMILSSKISNEAFVNHAVVV